ncbi:DUF4232 domain-containing protein [Streptomyces lichenis]|uniref:DUF4232 domain-containing protein n=1 Tax=Streptomyces lichenis TaxID=2306967 RepID=A0ABT0IFL8_9ACTN|nr:DUF4232 domain-containing protein [Streptomyces lichenis]MCK8680070.1 DUF4232 domain-containing protein [Streptomyces lichenis]
MPDGPAARPPEHRPLRVARWAAGVLGAVALVVGAGPLLAGGDDETGSAPLPVREASPSVREARPPAGAGSPPGGAGSPPGGAESPPVRAEGLPPTADAPPYGTVPSPPGGVSAGPSAEAAGPCPAGGVRVATGMVDGATGVRAMEVSLANCGARPVRVSGYPVVKVLDGASAPMESVTVHQGSGTDGAHKPMTFRLEPGERAVAAVVWRNTVTLSDRPAAQGAYLAVTPVPGAPAQQVRPGDGGPLDLGTTDRVEVTAWRPERA